MFSQKLKMEIAEKIQSILQQIEDDELPNRGEINFILHVDGAEDWSWANIRNSTRKYVPPPDCLIGNETAQ